MLLSAGVVLEKFDWKDHAFTNFSRLSTVVFTYHMLCYVWHAEKVEWALSKLTLQNSILPLVLCYVIYDFFYCLWHRALHHKVLYRHIHKHHHRQHAPSRYHHPRPSAPPQGYGPAVLTQRSPPHPEKKIWPERAPERL